MSTIAKVLETRERPLHVVEAEASVLDAVREMVGYHVRALLVREHDTPVGILSVRDVLTRVLLEQRDAATTSVADVMTPDVVSIEPAVESGDAMAIMAARHVHHLAVMEQSTVIGIVSFVDLVEWASRDQDFELQTLREYAFGPYSR